MAGKAFVDSFAKNKKTSRESVELTGVITNRLLYHAMKGNPDYKNDIMCLDKLYNLLSLDSNTKLGLEAIRDFLPKVPGELFNRYAAIKKELELLEEQGLETLVIGACGLSPIGLVFAENKNLQVYDTDLENIISFRKSLGISNKPCYHLVQLDLLNKAQVESFVASIAKNKSAMLIEGLTFYLNDKQRRKLHRNLKLISNYMQNNITFVFDYFVSEKRGSERDTVKDETSPRWGIFKNLIDNIHKEQRCFFKTRNDVIKYLISEGFGSVKVSRFSDKDNAHTIFLARY